MSQFLDAIKQARSEAKRQYVLNLILGGIAAFALFGWKAAGGEFTVHLPPDLRNGATLHVGSVPDVPPADVYLFAFYAWQQLNRWPTDGDKEYGAAIFRLQNYITPSCREKMIADQSARAKAGELYHRTRAISEIPGLGFTDERVVVVSPNTWTVLLDNQLQESQNGTQLKDTYIRYPMRVVRYDVDRDKNPFQLALDCFGDDHPERLDTHAVEQAIASQGPAMVKPAAPQPVSPLAVGGPAAAVGPSPVAPMSAIPAAIHPGAAPTR